MRRILRRSPDLNRAHPNLLCVLQVVEVGGYHGYGGRGEGEEGTGGGVGFGVGFVGLHEVTG